MKYVPYHKLGETKNIIADGEPNEHTELTLSHWPGTKLPEQLQADVSAEIVFNYLESPEYQVSVEAVSNNHFDEDGLVSLWTLLNPEEALERRDLLIDVATAGDFGTYRDRDAARISFIINAWTDPQASPLKTSVFALPYEEQVLILYEELLQRFDKVVDRFDYLERYWSAQDHILDKSEQALSNGTATITHYENADLAVIKIHPLPQLAAATARSAEAAARAADATERTAQMPWDKIMHPMAIHNNTDAMRVLLMQGNRYSLYYRYETWVQYVSRALQPRIDLDPLCEQLNVAETAGASWKFDGVGAIVPRMQPVSVKSSIPQDELVDMIVSYLVSHGTANAEQND